MPTYGITVRGAVQDVGFRDLVETLGKVHGLKGFVYTVKDGTVRIVAGCNCRRGRLRRRMHESSQRADVPVREIETKETDEPKPPPSTFFKAPTDDWSDIRRKLDEGIQVLRDIKEDTAAIGDDR